MGGIESGGGIMSLIRLWLMSAKNHFLSQYSNRANFTAGVVGMIVNNGIMLFGLWSMLFAGKSQFDSEREAFLIMNFVLMVSWGWIHTWTGGIVEIEKAINDGGLDIALACPRKTQHILSISNSYIPAWGDMIFGAVGLVVFSVQKGVWFGLSAAVMIGASAWALYSFFVFTGAMAFWFRRTEVLHALLVNIALSLNTYPIVSTSNTNFRWLIYGGPLLLCGLIPTRYLIEPSILVFALEFLGAFVFHVFVGAIFKSGLKQYKSVAVPNYHR